MRIKKVDIPASDGLADIKMDRLDKIVLIAGKNGSGKTRILKKIFEKFPHKPKKTIVEKAFELSKSLSQQLQTLEGASKKAIPTPSGSTVLPSPSSYYTSRIELVKNQINTSQELSVLKWKFIETYELAEQYSAVYYVPKNLNLSNPNDFTKTNLSGIAQNVEKLGIDRLAEGALAKIQVIQDKWFNATHQHSTANQSEKQKAIEDYERLVKLIAVFLNSEIGRTIDDEATLFGLTLGHTNLSDGQKVLLQYCLAIYSQSTSLRDIVLILDEPENHLHPSVIIETIERLQENIVDGQIWIATHSVTLLAHFDPSSIWFVENGRIRHAGKIPEKVLSSLLGDENEIAKLQDFISLPAQYASSRYAFESLFEPKAVMTESQDSQSKQIRSELQKLSVNSKLRVLDYGAGKGRVISNLVDLDETEKEKVLESIDYIAYDKYLFDKTDCELAITKAYISCENRYFNDMNNLLSIYDKGSFGVIIMCNVLHEIDPKDWLKLFREGGIISSLLNEQGVLLLVEDHQIPIGEKAYQKGFLVLDTPQIKELFRIKESDSDFGFDDKRGDGRLKAHRIPKRCLVRIDEESRSKAIKSLSDIAKEKIIHIRELEKNYQNGKLHGFWTQQFANAQLNLSELSAQ